MKTARNALLVILSAVIATASASQISVEYKTQSDWGAGMVGEIRLTNSGADEVKDWRLRFRFASAIEGLWGGKILERDGDS